MKKVLVIGGNSNIGEEIIKQLEKNGYEISLRTYRNESKKKNGYSWSYLDIYDKQSVLRFVAELKQNEYEKIIFTIGNSTGKQGYELTLEDLDQFYSATIINYIYILQSVVKSLTDTGQIVFLSSVAANEAIHDIHYSAAKAAVQACAKSLSLYMKPEQSIFSIAPGLVYDTPAMYMNPFDVYKDHIQELAKKEQIAGLILNSDRTYNGKVINIGHK
jgi:NAD(P)-dependent dehydrogenase (short-subunit alcohol dehydrogenase family)